MKISKYEYFNVDWFILTNRNSIVFYFLSNEKNTGIQIKRYIFSFFHRKFIWKYRNSLKPAIPAKTVAALEFRAKVPTYYCWRGSSETNVRNEKSVWIFRSMLLGWQHNLRLRQSSTQMVYENRGNQELGGRWNVPDPPGEITLVWILGLGGDWARPILFRVKGRSPIS